MRNYSKPEIIKKLTSTSKEKLFEYISQFSDIEYGGDIVSILSKKDVIDMLYTMPTGILKKIKRIDQRNKQLTNLAYK